MCHNEISASFFTIGFKVHKTPLQIYKLNLLILFLGLLPLNSIQGNVPCEIFDPNSQQTVLDRSLKQPNQFSLAPEIYRLHRFRKGGTRQHGTLCGVRAGYDFIKRYNFSFGIQAFYGRGTLRGKTSQNLSSRSHWSDEQIEAYAGYTFQTKTPLCFSFTPFGGYGYFREINQFISPSPVKFRSTTQFDYFLYGFLSSANVTPCTKIGVNARFRTPWDQKCKVSKDPENEDTTQRIGDSFQFRIELPVRYHTPWGCNHFEIGIMPFYEQRLYEGRIGYPENYLRTKIIIYGIDLQLVFQF